MRRSTNRKQAAPAREAPLASSDINVKTAWHYYVEA